MGMRAAVEVPGEKVPDERVPREMGSMGLRAAVRAPLIVRRSTGEVPSPKPARLEPQHAALQKPPRHPRLKLKPRAVAVEVAAPTQPSTVASLAETSEADSATESEEESKTDEEEVPHTEAQVERLSDTEALAEDDVEPRPLLSRLEMRWPQIKGSCSVSRNDSRNDSRDDSRNVTRNVTRDVTPTPSPGTAGGPSAAGRECLAEAWRGVGAAKGASDAVQSPLRCGSRRERGSATPSSSPAGSASSTG